MITGRNRAVLEGPARKLGVFFELRCVMFVYGWTCTANFHILIDTHKHAIKRAIAPTHEHACLLKHAHTHTRKPHTHAQ